MAFYECIFITRADLSKQDVTKLTEEFSTIITEDGGSVAKQEYWGLRTLAYKINKVSKGHYFMLVADCEASAINEITRQAGLNENIVRNLNVKVDKVSEEPSAVMSSEGDGQRRPYRQNSAA